MTQCNFETREGETTTNYWLAVGSPANWKTAFEHGNIWGLKKTQNHLWEMISENDILLFCATQPISGIIGYGPIQVKFRQDQPLWPQEISENQVIWPLRFEFDVEYCFPPNDWKTLKITSDVLKTRVRSGFQRLEANLADELISRLVPFRKPLTKRRDLAAVKETVAIYTEREQTVQYSPSHEEVKQKLVEIGKLQKYLAEAEYTFDIGKLDVVWRRVERSVPTYVFEVQVGGDVYHALAKLKHAFDLWNSHIFLVASQADRSKVNNLLSGTFHEINNEVNFVELEKVEELYKRKKAYLDFEKELGF